MNYKPRTGWLFVCLLVLLSIAVWAAFRSTQTQGASAPQNANDNTNSQKKEKRIEEVTVREGTNKVKCKTGYEFVRVSTNEVTVRSVGARGKTQEGPVITGSYHCRCNDTTGNGSCDGEMVKGFFVCVPQGCKSCKLTIP